MIYRIALSNTEAHKIGLQTPVPYGTAKLTIGTVAYWAERTDYIPQIGEIVVYSDRTVIDGVSYPGVKIGDGKAYGVDLPFVGDDKVSAVLDILDRHINDNSVHLMPGERERWNNKLDCRVDGERLILEGTDLNG